MSRSSQQRVPKQQRDRGLQTWQRHCQLQTPSDQMQRQMQQQRSASSLHCGSAPGKLQELPGPYAWGLHVCCSSFGCYLLSCCSLAEHLHATTLCCTELHAISHAMTVCCRRLQALDAYSDQMQRRDEEIDVLECALLIAKHAHPDLVMVAVVPLLAASATTA